MLNRYNNLIYIVTVFQAIFLPLQTITAIYGMNFDVMPELRFYYSYPIFWIVCIVVAIVIAVPLFRFRFCSNKHSTNVVSSPQPISKDKEWKELNKRDPAFGVVSNSS